MQVCAQRTWCWDTRFVNTGTDSRATATVTRATIAPPKAQGRRRLGLATNASTAATVDAGKTCFQRSSSRHTRQGTICGSAATTRRQTAAAGGVRVRGGLRGVLTRTSSTTTHREEVQKGQVASDDDCDLCAHRHTASGLRCCWWWTTQ
jgi:hypothetical protein